MGLTHVAVQVRNHRSKDSFTEKFLVDTGAWNSFAPAYKLESIGIEPIGRKEFELANGQVEEYEFAFAEMEFLDELIVTRIIFGPSRCSGFRDSRIHRRSTKSDFTEANGIPAKNRDFGEKSYRRIAAPH